VAPESSCRVNGPTLEQGPQIDRFLLSLLQDPVHSAKNPRLLRASQRLPRHRCTERPVGDRTSGSRLGAFLTLNLRGGIFGSSRFTLGQSDRSVFWAKTLNLFGSEQNPAGVDFLLGQEISKLASHALLSSEN